MSFSNLRDHCAFALTVLLSGNGTKSGGGREGQHLLGRMRMRMRTAPRPAGPWWDGRGGAPVCHRVPTLVIPVGEGCGVPWAQPSVLTGASCPPLAAFAAILAAPMG